MIEESLPPGFRCDLFCRVVDHYGDAGVTWRLARQLVGEYGWRVRLFIDDLHPLTFMAPGLDERCETQIQQGVEITHWGAGVEWGGAEVVIEAFACNPPDDYIATMAKRPSPPCWLNLEYLSAEQWVGEHHLLPSPHPRLALTKTFFFPGFLPSTGGLLRERDLLQRRDAFVETNGKDDGGVSRVFLFCYENQALPALLEAWQHSTPPIRCRVPEGVAENSPDLNRNQSLVDRVARCPQEKFDEWLWASEFVFVRGEDSFVRAQWAARPFVWHIYPQDDGAHWKKLDAFLGLYCEGLSAGASQAVRDIHAAWNGQDSAAIGTAWHQFFSQRSELQQHARRWADRLAAMPDLATQLVTFCRKVVKI